VEIRNARLDQREALGELHRRSSYLWEEDRVNLEAHPDVLGVSREAIDEQRVRVATGENGALVGFAVVAAGPTTVCVLDDLFVEPALLRRGIGRALVEDAAARAASAGYLTLTVIAHSRNFAFYESVGFVRGEPTKTRFGPATKMRRRLTSSIPGELKE
jgi:GNAT superfamily N-acetyltransferase